MKKAIYVAIERTIKKYISPVQSLPCHSVPGNKGGGWILEFISSNSIRIYAPKHIFKYHCDNTISDHQQSRLHLLALSEFRHNHMICLYPSQKHRDDLSLLSAILRAPVQIAHFILVFCLPLCLKNVHILSALPTRVP